MKTVVTTIILEHLPVVVITIINNSLNSLSTDSYDMNDGSFS